MKNIDLLLLDAFDFGGIERASDTLIRAFKRDGIKCRLVSVREQCGKRSFDYIENPTILRQGCCEILKLFHYAKSLTDDTLVISTYDRISILLSFVFILLRKKNVIIAHQHADYYAHNNKVRFLRRIFYRRVNVVCALTRKDVGFYSKWHPKAIFVPNILQLKTSCKYIPLGERTTDLIAIGRLDTVKRFEHFIGVSSNLLENGEAKSAKLIGDGPDLNRLKQVDRCNIIQGRNDNVLPLLADSKVLLVTSHRESFSMVILEAMSQGTIVVSYNCPTGPEELIKDAVNGFLIENGNVEAMTMKCKYVLENISSLGAVSQAAIVTSMQYSPANIMNKWKKIINEC